LRWRQEHQAKDIKAAKRLARHGMKANTGADEMAEDLTPFDPAQGLTSDEAIAGLMAEAFKTGTPTISPMR
jgi:hypothetical protein